MDNEETNELEKIQENTENINENVEETQQEKVETEPENKLYVTVVSQSVTEVFTVNESCLFKQVRT